MKRTENSLRDLWDRIKRTNIQIIRVPEEEKKKKGHEKFFEEIITGISRVVQWLRLCAPNGGGPGLIPGQKTRSHML